MLVIGVLAWLAGGKLVAAAGHESAGGDEPQRFRWLLDLPRAVQVARRGDPGQREFLGWAALFGAAEIVAAVMPAAWAYGVLLVVVGAAIQLFAVSATVYVQKAAPPAQRAHALSAYNAGFMGFVPAGSVLVAAIAASVGVRWALIGPGAVIAACAIAALASRDEQS